MSNASVNELLSTLQFFQTTGHECSYLAEREASTVFVDPSAKLSTDVYSRLALAGFRRSGRYIYRPRCRTCNACIPIRLPVRDFKPNRAQRRVIKKNSDLSVKICENEFQEEHYALYERYLRSRHKDSGMDDTSPEKYTGFLTCEWMQTRFVEFRLKEKLMAVAVTDFIQDGLSALYTFFDPDKDKRSLGVFAILWQIKTSRELNKKWLFLGYWIKDARKMSYKTSYKPYEMLINGSWKAGK